MGVRALRGDGESTICHHGVPEPLPHWGHQVRPGTGSVFDNASKAIETQLWHTMHRCHASSSLHQRSLLLLLQLNYFDLQLGLTLSRSATLLKRPFIGGMFGAGKTRSAAVLLAGLLVFNPAFMVVTKENVAAHAFAEHLVALQLPQEVQQLMGRLVGYYEHRRKEAGTPLDLPIENRNNHIRQKSSLIGCGSAFPECGQPFSPVSDWIKQVDIALEDVFWLPAARVRVPGGSPFSQLQRCEKDNFTFVKATKTFTIIGQNNERINQTNSKTN